MLLNPSEYLSSLKQSTFAYLFYLLLTPVNLVIVNQSGQGDVIPIGLVLGPGITLLNTLSSSSANSKFQKELEENSIIGKTIKPDEDLKGLIAIRNIGYQPLSIKIRN
ncbi:MAG: hypothetical protein K8S23_06510 [Candidatus Cloacimonetes bacterium]|nr:hypothetical protein [Candidatus Cloacimonadota bacterium]